MYGFLEPKTTGLLMAGEMPATYEEIAPAPKGNGDIVASALNALVSSGMGVTQIDTQKEAHGFCTWELRGEFLSMEAMLGFTAWVGSLPPGVK